MPKIKVLLLEDSPTDAVFVQRSLRDVATVDVAIDKKHFIEMLKEKWDLIILDWKVNELRGEESVVLSRAANVDVPLILLTGSLDEESATAALRIGFTDYLRKDRMERLPHAVQEAYDKRLLKAQALRDNRLEILGHMTAGYNHDLNQLLQVFMSGPEILRRVIADHMPVVPEEITRVLDVMDSTSRRGAEMSRQIATFVRGSNGNSMKAVSPEFLLTELGAMLRDSFPTNIRVTTKTMPGTSLAECNASQIGQVLLNLACNAKDSMTPNGGEIHITAQNAATVAGPRIRIEVRDTGSGIPANVLPKIFDAFYTTKGVGQGTGLGLSMAQKIMNDHGGHISVETGPTGTAFAIFIPVAHVDTHAESMSNLSDFDGGGKKVLICDDEAHMRLMIEIFLQDANYETLTAASGMEALSYFRSNHNIAALLTDVSMPHFTGPQLLEALRCQSYDLPIIFLTGHADVDAKKFDPPPTAILAKPFSRSLLLETLRDVLLKV